MKRPVSGIIEMKLFRIREHALISLILVGTIVALLTPIGNVHAVTVTLTKEHHPSSTFTDPSGTVDGYLMGQTITWRIHLNVTTSTAPFPWLSIEDFSIVDSLPNTLGGGPLYTTYVAGSQASSSAAGAATFTDFENGTLLWNFGHGPFTTGVLSPPPFQDPTQFYTASIVFNSTINGNVPDNTFLTNTGVAHYTETDSQVHDAPSISDVIWVPAPVLNIVKVSPSTVENGSSFNYVLQLSNTAHEDATGVVVQDIMPTGITHNPPATAASGSFITDTSTNVTWTGTLFNVTNPGNTVNITIPVTVNTRLTSVFNSASFIAYPSDAQFTNQSANCTTSITILPISPLTVSILPLGPTTLDVGQSLDINSTVSGGTWPYSYQWILNGTPVSGATSGGWIFTPASAGSYTVYLNVTDSLGNIAISNTVTATVNIHDVAVTNTEPSKTVVGHGFSANMNVTVANLGSCQETFNLTLYATVFIVQQNVTLQVASQNVTLESGIHANITFVFNTAGYPYGNYTLSAYAMPIPGETDTANNNCTGGWVCVSIKGDITGGTPNLLDFVPDGKVDMRDIGIVARYFGQNVPPAPSNCDPTGPTAGVPDGKIDMRDIGLVAKHFGDSYS